jgi:hypothetical protein
MRRCCTLIHTHTKIQILAARRQARKGERKRGDGDQGRDGCLLNAEGNELGLRDLSACVHRERAERDTHM